MANKDGIQYRIQPDELGSQFACRKMDYKEYLYLQKKGSRRPIGLTLAMTSGFGRKGEDSLRLFYNNMKVKPKPLK
ncbi:hypothetical protein UB32_01630 [Mesobacillus subterraneus]|uniref:Uncharacterized protein n=1 Tax=Mesobacillus subterraneus TaxID=285983 RepID=A0A0D6ZEJ7_9BACI|nr:hypothetical protein UB32_01630 [Mesobacillus subterraneus]